MTASGASAEALRAERRRVDLARKFLGQAQRIVDAELTGLGIIYTADGLSITRFTTPSGSLEFAIPIDATDPRPLLVSIFSETRADPDFVLAAAPDDSDAHRRQGDRDLDTIPVTTDTLAQIAAGIGRGNVAEIDAYNSPACQWALAYLASMEQGLTPD
jgi:hypothetical protein